MNSLTKGESKFRSSIFATWTQQPNTTSSLTQERISQQLSHLPSVFTTRVDWLKNFILTAVWLGIAALQRDGWEEVIHPNGISTLKSATSAPCGREKCFWLLYKAKRIMRVWMTLWRSLTLLTQHSTPGQLGCAARRWLVSATRRQAPRVYKWRPAVKEEQRRCRSRSRHRASSSPDYTWRHLSNPATSNWEWVAHWKQSHTD